MKLLCVSLCFVCVVVSYLAFNPSEYNEKLSNNKKEARLCFQKTLDECLDRALSDGYDYFTCEIPKEIRYHLNSQDNIIADVISETQQSLKSVGYHFGCERFRSPGVVYSQSAILECAIKFDAELAINRNL